MSNYPEMVKVDLIMLDDKLDDQLKNNILRQLDIKNLVPKLIVIRNDGVEHNSDEDLSSALPPVVSRHFSEKDLDGYLRKFGYICDKRIEQYNFYVRVQPINYLNGGKLGDFIHLLYVVKGNYIKTGAKGNVYITNDIKFGGDLFSCPIEQTYRELYDLVCYQDYIEKFEIYNGQHIDISLNMWRFIPELINTSPWLKFLSRIYNIELSLNSWVTLPSNLDDKYENTILIHRSLRVEHQILNKNFINFLEKIITNNNCLFITCNKQEYDSFPLKHLITLELKSNLSEMYAAINSCKFFIGNQSSLLAMAYSIFKPLLCEHPCFKFYTISYYEDISWVSQFNNQLSFYQSPNLSRYIDGIDENILYK